MHRGRVKYCLNKACWGTAVKLVKNYIICYPDFPSKRQTLARLITEIKNNGPCTLTVHISHRTVCASVEYFASACDWVTAVCLLRASEPVFSPRGAARQKELSFCPPRTLILCSSTYVLTPVCACCFSFLPVHMRTCIGSMNGREGRLASCFHRSTQWISSHLCFVMFVLSGIHWEPQISGELQGSFHRHQDRCVLYSKLFNEFLSYLSMVKSECINYYKEPGFGGYSFYKNYIFPFFCDFCRHFFVVFLGQICIT